MKNFNLFTLNSGIIIALLIGIRVMGHVNKGKPLNFINLGLGVITCFAFSSFMQYFMFVHEEVEFQWTIFLKTVTLSGLLFTIGWTGMWAFMDDEHKVLKYNFSPAAIILLVCAAISILGLAGLPKIPHKDVHYVGYHYDSAFRYLRDEDPLYRRLGVIFYTMAPHFEATCEIHRAENAVVIQKRHELQVVIFFLMVCGCSLAYMSREKIRE